MSISTVILAAGANVRLNGLVAPYHKPLMLVNGKPLVRHAFDHASDWGSNRVTVIVSPKNAEPITALVPNTALFIVQPQPRGVVDALHLVKDRIKDDEHTLILCADNTFSDPPRGKPRVPCFGFRSVHSVDWQRFTRFKNPRSGSPHLEEKGIILIEASAPEQGDGCWIGPLLLNTERVLNALRIPHSTVVEFIRAASDNGADLTPIAMQCSDLGVPEEVS